MPKNSKIKYTIEQRAVKQVRHQLMSPFCSAETIVSALKEQGLLREGVTDEQERV